MPVRIFRASFLFLIFLSLQFCSSTPAVVDRKPSQIIDLSRTCYGDPAACALPEHSSPSIKSVEGAVAETVFLALENDFVIGPHFDSDGGETFLLTRKNRKVSCMRVTRWAKAGDRTQPASISYRCQGDFR